MIVSLNGDDTFTDDDLSETFRVHVPVHEDGAPPLVCLHCGEEIDHDGEGGYHHLDPSDDDNPQLCDGFEPDDEDNQAEPAPTPLAWCNSAGLTLDPDDDAVHVRVSIGDPRGAFVMTVRRLPDGRIVLHLPYPGQPMAHAVTAPLHDGTLVVVR